MSPTSQIFRRDRKLVDLRDNITSNRSVISMDLRYRRHFAMSVSHWENEFQNRLIVRMETSTPQFDRCEVYLNI